MMSVTVSDAPTVSSSLPASPGSALRGSQVQLGPLVPADAVPLFRWINDSDAANLDLSYRPIDWTNFQSWFNGIGNDATKIVFAIRRIETSGILGYVQIKNIDPVHHSAEVGIRIGDETNRSQGIGTEALRVAVAYGWRTLNLHRMALSVFSGNQRALRAYAAVGFKKEGVLRQARYINGRWIDVVIMGAIRPRTLAPA